MQRILLTGAAGMVGSHVLRHLIIHTDAEIVCPVTFRHRGVPRRIDVALTDLPDGSMLPWDRIKIIRCDLAAPIDEDTANRFGQADIDVILNIASESHVDRSIEYPRPFVENNVGIALSMLEFARGCPNLEVFVQMSTDEVYGPAAVGADSREWDPIVPSNPYSASKAAQEALCVSWWRTYGLPLILVNGMNLLAETQDAEKYLPMIISKALKGEKLKVHAAPDGTIGSRFYLHARNLADAMLFLVGLAEAGTLNEESYADHVEGLRYGHGINRPLRFNIVGERELDNLELATLARSEVLNWTKAMLGDLRPAHLKNPGNDWYELESFHEHRPGHDLRYALDGERMAELGWKAPVPLEASVRKIVRWTLDHREFLG